MAGPRVRVSSSGSQVSPKGPGCGVRTQGGLQDSGGVGGGDHLPRCKYIS